MTEDPEDPGAEPWIVEQAFELHKLISSRTNRRETSRPDDARSDPDDDHAVKDED